MRAAASTAGLQMVDDGVSAQVLEEVMGRKPYFVRNGGTIPAAALFQQVLWSVCTHVSCMLLLELLCIYHHMALHSMLTAEHSAGTNRTDGSTLHCRFWASISQCSASVCPMITCTAQTRGEEYSARPTRAYHQGCAAVTMRPRTAAPMKSGLCADDRTFSRTRNMLQFTCAESASHVRA